MSRSRGGLGTPAWGVFCASSWTWCIGMFLPVILFERWGWAGVATFAIPNVLGCAAFGYVVGTRARSEAMVRDHGRAMAWFSLASIAFHVYFAAFACQFIVGDGTASWLVVAVPLGLYLAALALSALPANAWPAAAALAYAISIGAAVSLGPEPLREATAGERSGLSLAGVAPVLVMGFLLCPYLDLTFHRALQRSPSRNAFAVFGVAFAIMLVVTCQYGATGRVNATPFVVGHLVAQGVFTVAAHLREIGLTRAIRPAMRPAWLAAPLLALPLILLTRLGTVPAATGADVYIRFLVLYGLVFPAYVLLHMGGGRRGPRRRELSLLLGIVLVSMPLYELGFLHGREWLLPIPVVGLVAASILRRRG